jgi:hypothetical protein
MIGAAAVVTSALSGRRTSPARTLSGQGTIRVQPAASGTASPRDRVREVGPWGRTRANANASMSRRAVRLGTIMPGGCATVYWNSLAGAPGRI